MSDNVKNEKLDKTENALIEQARKGYKGQLKLQIPIKAKDQDVDALHYDFNLLTGIDYVRATSGTRNAFGIEPDSALKLFAQSCEKACGEERTVDWRDVYERISAQDAVVAVQLATNFFNASFRAGSKNISND